jgi:penicillin amidase
MRRLLTRALWSLVVGVALVVGGAYWYLRQSLPVVSGTVTVRGLSGAVDVIRDRDAVPHIFATSKPDALFGLGYAHAQDRLWQMEFQRRIGHGRLSEIFGEAALSQDRFLRTVGFGRAARAAWERLPADARRDIEAYVAGVNAFLDTHHGRHLPPEFTLLRFEPEPWTGADVLVWIKMMAWDLSANYSSELLRHDLAAKVGPEGLAALMPPYPVNGLSVITNRGSAPDPGSTSQPERPSGLRRTTGSWSAAFAHMVSDGHPAVRDLLLGGARTEALGSNNWVVDGALTASGKPLLANDPHLGTHVPSLWYLAHLSAGAFDVIGATLPGVPAVAIGRNRSIAWGETNAAADVQDFYRERLDAAGAAAAFRGAWEPLRIVREEIGIKDREPLRIDVRISRHGPLVSDAINAVAAANAAATPNQPIAEPLEPLALRWTALDDDDTTIVAFLRLNDARNWTEFTSALEHFVAPAQNFVYADIEGHIGYYLPGRIPMRASGDGSRPTEGWAGATEWTGLVPFAELPHAFDPPTHAIVTANHRPVLGGRHLIGLEYPEPYRAQRITDLLADRRGLTPDDFRAVQADTLSLHAQALLPLLLQHANATDSLDRQALDILRSWQYDARGDSAAAAIFEAWFLKLAPVLVGDDLGARIAEGYTGRFSYITRFVTATVSRNDTRWCDDVATPALEDCRQSVTRALHEAVASLRQRLRGDMPQWRWDAVHRAVFPHQGLDAVRVLRPWLGRSMPNGGDWSTVNVGPVDADRPYEQRSIPGYRQIVDLSPSHDSRFLDAVGQSGHVLSSRYDDFLKDWQAVQHRPMRMRRETIEHDAIGTLRLVPQPQ